MEVEALITVQMQNAIVYELSLRRTLRYSFQIVAFAEAPDFLAPATYLVTSPYLAAGRRKRERSTGRRAHFVFE